MPNCSIKSVHSINAIRFLLPLLLLQTSLVTPLLAQEQSPVNSASSNAAGAGAGAGATPTPTTASPVEKKETSLYVDFLKLEERVYSQSKKIEIGDRTDLEAALRYQFDSETFARLRLDTDPNQNAYNSKTSNFEILGNHRDGPIEIQIDFDLNTNDGKNGGISMGLDSDSKGSFIAYSPLEDRERLKFSFYPYNFGGEVGRAFNTWDVTRLYYIDGAPPSIQIVPQKNESIKSKTIPGIVMSTKVFNALTLYVGAGAASYLHPSNADFDLEKNVGATRWEWRQDTGYKLGYKWNNESFNIVFQHVGHDKSDETGSLLANASSMQVDYKLSNLVLQGEVTRSKAGKKPFRVSRETTWFQDIAPFHPIYSDYYEKPQDWLGKTGTAWMLSAGWQIDQALPYLGYAYRSKYFVYREPESAHTLRTSDDTASHGGLRSYILGAKFQFGRIMLNPQFDWMLANNKVFGDSSDVRDDALLADYNKHNFLITMKLAYNTDEKTN